MKYRVLISVMSSLGLVLWLVLLYGNVVRKSTNSGAIRDAETPVVIMIEPVPSLDITEYDAYYEAQIPSPNPININLRNKLFALKQKVAYAAAYLGREGEAGLERFNDRDSYWAQEPYVFVWDLQGVSVANPNNTVLVGKSLIGLTDIRGNNFAIEFAKIAADYAHGNKGWCEYWWNKMGDDKPFHKISYIKRVSGTNWLLGAGIYIDNVNKYDVIRAVGD